MKINVISLAAYVLLFLIVAKGAFSINGNSKLSLENTKLRGEISKLDSEIPRLEFERGRQHRRLKHLGERESIWLSTRQKNESTLFRLNAEKAAKKRFHKLEEDLKKAKEELAKSETKKKKAPQRPKMSSRRKYFLTHGMYPEQYAARQSQRAIVSEQRRVAQVEHAKKQQIARVQQQKQQFEDWINNPTPLERATLQRQENKRYRDGAVGIAAGLRRGSPEMVRRGIRIQQGLPSITD
jgi:hypothetical protein